MRGRAGVRAVHAAQRNVANGDEGGDVCGVGRLMNKDSNLNKR